MTVSLLTEDFFRHHRLRLLRLRPLLRHIITTGQGRASMEEGRYTDHRHHRLRIITQDPDRRHHRLRIIAPDPDRDRQCRLITLDPDRDRRCRLTIRDLDRDQDLDLDRLIPDPDPEQEYRCSRVIR